MGRVERYAAFPYCSAPTLLYNLIVCEHIYRNMNSEICPSCNLPTHEINWKYVNEQHKIWKENNPNHEVVWWSI